MNRAAFTNRHKVRGWKTQIRRVERWRQAHLTPDWVHLEHTDFDSCKFQIDPWNRLIRRQPPMWLARRMLHGLLDIHEAWAAAVPDAPYLRLWLNWPHVIDSQVVMAQGSRVDWYREMFRPVAELGWARAKGFPPQFGPALLQRLNAWDWQECLHEYPVDPADIGAGRLSRYAYSTLTTTGASLTLVEVGRVWVGTRRAA
ncbi:hypothetical protein MF271_14585 [Deinococcus sp. KNUC1210]|uniref:hypothetical protein n=1 Tax=Deinococcus sp. KNUC1210 TaxID=2917691 RepID=UPI001EF0E5B8|nr:hypothetical protein [Deinococcus sp. KNUC1210]ULH15167.1 hypothetical protein MF271_14585 [Deinococcus sp. KNUC1210]